MTTKNRKWILGGTLVAVLLVALALSASLLARGKDPVPAAGVQQTLVTRATEQLSKDLNVPAASVKLVAVETATWPDASLGCPEPDTLYAPVLTAGHRIKLQVGDKVYEYHGADRADGRLIQCSNNPGV
jgi:hypothetical protein